MGMKNKIKLLVFCLSASIKSFAQEPLQTLNAEQVLQLVRTFHPITRQIAIEVEKAQADILFAKGAFDPILSNYIAQKTFDGTNYYTISNPEIRIPTWYGIEVFGGLENLSGNRFAVSETVGKTSYFGLNIPLAKNLLLDKRRAYLQQAKIFNQMALADQRVAVNNLLMSAMEAYWAWVKAYQTYKIVSENVIVNEKRVEFVKNSYANGERAAIDTVEAVAQLQSFQNQQNSYWLAFQNAGLELSVYLWQNNNVPYQLPESVVPQNGWENETNISLFNLELDALQNIARSNHPYLQVYNYKLGALEIDKKLKFQELLPKIDFQYNQLGKGYRFLETATQLPLFENNFQYGIKMEMPLRFSQGRSNYKQAKLKIEETTLDQNQKLQQIQNKLKSYFNEFETLKKQIEIQTNNYKNYQKLVVAEETKLFNGESTLFLVNSRENKALEALEKLIDLKTKYYKTIYSLQWSAGLLI
jgi:outer membrane protein TolC